MSLIDSIHDKSHILGLYSSQDQKIEEGLKYLRIGFEQKNEAILMVIDELSKNKVRNKISYEWKISPTNLAQLEKNGIITLKSPKEFYFFKDVQTLEKAIKQYSYITSKAIEIGKSGLTIVYGFMHSIYHIGIIFLCSFYFRITTIVS